MLKTWISRGAKIAPAGFAIVTLYQRRIDAKEHDRREALQTVAIALRDVTREAFAMRYRGPNTLHTTQQHLGLVIQAVKEPLPATLAVASANDAAEIERLEQAAFDELGALLGQSGLRRGRRAEPVPRGKARLALLALAPGLYEHLPRRQRLPARADPD
jgi:hypothetical protein